MHSDQYILVTFVMTELGHMTVEFLLPKSDSMEMTSDVKVGRNWSCSLQSSAPVEPERKMTHMQTSQSGLQNYKHKSE